MTYDFKNLIGSIKLSTGSHKNPDQGMCAMEFVSWLEGEEFSDHPECTCPVIAAFVRVINDRVDQGGRDRLLEYLPRIVGTLSKQHEQERAEYFAWQAILVFGPNALKSIGLHQHANNLKAATNFNAAYAAASAAASAARVAAYAAASAAASAARAARAARVARVAASAASAASAARVASAAASTAAYAVADAAADYDEIFKCLEGALEIGPQSQGFSIAIEPTIQKAKELCPL